MKKITMKELFEMGYKVVVGNAYGDSVMETLEDVENAIEEGAELEELDEKAKTAYFYVDIFADEEEWGEDL